MFNEQSKTSIPDSYSSCVNRLPCGVCRLTNQLCPIGVTRLEPTWTCSSETSGTAGFGFQKEEDER